MAGPSPIHFRAKDGKEILLRPLAPRDIDALLAFANVLVKEKQVNRDIGIAGFDKRLTRKKENKFLRAIVGGSKKRAGVDIAAFDGPRMVGECTFNRREVQEMHHTGVLGIVVIAGYRGLGIGEAMITEVMRRAEGIRVSLIELEVMATNTNAIRLYRKHGFKEVGLVPGKVRRDGRLIDLVSMYADLGNR